MKRILVPAISLFVTLFVGLTVVAQEVDKRSVARAALFDAIEAGDKDEVLRILARRRHVNLNHREFGDGETFLIEAIRAGQPEIVDILLKHGANPHLREIPGPEEEEEEEEEKTDGDTPLEAALALEENWAEMVQLLIKHGLNLSQQQSALHAATSIEMLRFLLDHGAPINGRDAHGATYLEVLVSDGYDESEMEEKAHLLLERGANVNIPDNDGATALSRCDSLELANLLIEHGANVNTADKRGMTPLHLAAADESRIDLAELMIAKGADVNARNNDGYTPLDLLITGSFDYEFALLLVAHGASVNDVIVIQHGLVDDFEEIRKAIASGQVPPYAVSSGR